MLNHTFIASFGLATLVNSVAVAQPKESVPRPAPTAPTAPTSVPPTPGLPDVSGPNAGVGQVTGNLQSKLAAMQTGSGLTSDEAARRALRNNVDVMAKQKSLEVAEATGDETRAGFIPKLQGQAGYTRYSKITPPPIPGLVSFPVFLNNYLFQGTLSVPLSDYVLRLSSSLASASHNTAAASWTCAPRDSQWRATLALTTTNGAPSRDAADR